MSKSCDQMPVVYAPSAASPVALIMRASIEKLGISIGTVLFRPAAAYCLTKLMPVPPGWNW